MDIILENSLVVIVMGVSGCGKTTVGKMLADTLKGSFFDADDFHPKENIAKMSKGLPLTDEDRSGWLEILAEHLKKREAEGVTVLACSALKEKYRTTLSKDLKNCKWVWLHGSYELIYKRMTQREGHYMSQDLLKSQFDILEEPAYALKVDIGSNPEQIINQIKSWI